MEEFEAIAHALGALLFGNNNVCKYFIFRIATMNLVKRIYSSVFILLFMTDCYNIQDICIRLLVIFHSIPVYV